MKSLLAFKYISKRVILHPFLFFCLFYTQAQTTESVHQLILNTNFRQADSILKHTNTPTPYTYLLSTYNYSLKLLLYENATAFNESFNHQVNIWEKACQQTDNTQPEHYFSLACITLLQGVVNYNYGAKLPAFFMLKKAKRLAEKSIKAHPDFVENQLLFGLLNTSMGMIPEKYTWITNPLGFQGVFTDGINALKKYQKQDGIFKNEAIISLHLVNSFLMDNHLEDIIALPATTVTEKIMKASIKIKSNDAKGAIQLLYNTPTSSPVKEILLAEAYLLVGKYDKAFIHAQLFLEKSKGKNYLKAANKLLYLSSLIGGLNKKQTTFLSNIEEKGALVTSKDKEALSFSKKPIKKVEPLYLSRLFTDGGEWSKAYTFIKKCPPSIEKTYRNARILHLSGKLNDAVPLYKEVLKDTTHQGYFLANSSLQLGYIYYSKKEQNTSVYYFNKARQLPAEAYDENIDLKARLALEAFYGR